MISSQAIAKQISLCNKLHLKYVILAGTPYHRNIGDRAIAYAERKFIRSKLPFRVLIETPYSTDLDALPSLRRDTLVLLHGGGNFGDIYPNEEEYRRQLIKAFHDYKIVLFPQTIFFNDTRNLRESASIYGAHPDLTILAREERSFSIIKDNFVNPVFLVPDIVFFLNERDSRAKRKGLLLIIRNDVEAILDDKDRDAVSCASDRFEPNVTWSDMEMMLAEEEVLNMSHEEITRHKLDQYLRHQIVVTDRLHGMIFALITGTPCVAFDSKTGKSEGVYRWVEEGGYADYIKICHDIKDLENVVASISNQESFAYNRTKYKEYWRTIESLF